MIHPGGHSELRVAADNMYQEMSKTTPTAWLETHTCLCGGIYMHVSVIF